MLWLYIDYSHMPSSLNSILSLFFARAYNSFLPGLFCLLCRYMTLPALVNVTELVAEALEAKRHDTFSSDAGHLPEVGSSSTKGLLNKAAKRQ
jgi:hypothetical protein